MSRRRVTVSIDDKTFCRYKSLANKHGVSLSAAMRYGLVEWMDLIGIDEVEVRVTPDKRFVITQGSKEQWGTKQTN